MLATINWFSSFNSPCRIHHFHYISQWGEDCRKCCKCKGWANLTHTQSEDELDRSVRSQSISASETLAQDSLFPSLPLFLPWGPLKRAGAAATALRWLLISLSQRHSWKLSRATHSAPSFPSFFSQHVIALLFPFLSWLYYFCSPVFMNKTVTAISLYIFQESKLLIKEGWWSECHTFIFPTLLTIYIKTGPFKKLFYFTEVICFLFAPYVQ